MKPPHQHTHINLDELKSRIMKKLGTEGSKQYFHYLNRFLSLKLSKIEFNKLCLRILGRENIPLHNQLIRSILKNACIAKTPPSANNHHDNDISNQVGSEEILSEGHHQKGFRISPSLNSKGVDTLLPVSPRKARTGSRDSRGVERRSALGPNGKTGFTHPSDFNIVLENGYSNPRPGEKMDMFQPSQHHQVGPVQKVPECENVGLKPSETDKISARSPILAPLGLSFCPASIGGARGAEGPLVGPLVGPFCDGALLDSRSLRKRMEGIALAEGLEGVSDDYCADVLNHGLDCYMKRLFKSCIETVGSRPSGCEPTKGNAEEKDIGREKLINGVESGLEYRLGNKGAPSDVVHGQKIDGRISLRDFRVAMEVNPRQLGEDWPVLLEKICTHSFGE